MSFQTPWLFIKQFPLLSRWLDLQQTRAHRLPEKVDRKDVPRGEIYPLTRSKTLFALFLSVLPMLKFKLKDLAQQMSVPYGTIRHWAKEERVQDKTHEFAKKFANHFMEELARLLLHLEKEGSENDPVLAEERENLRQEAIHFAGPIQEHFLKALVQLFEHAPNNRQRNIALLEFVDDLIKGMRFVKHDTAKRGVEEYDNLYHQTLKKKIELYLDSFEYQIKSNPEGALESVQGLREYMDLLLRRSHNFTLPSLRRQTKGRAENKALPKKRGGYKKGTLRDPVDIVLAERGEKPRKK
jgi:hypothetical protein